MVVERTIVLEMPLRKFRKRVISQSMWIIMEYILYDSHVIPRVVSAKPDRAIIEKYTVIREYGTDVECHCKDDCEQRAKRSARFQSFNQWLFGFSGLAGLLWK